MLLDCLPGAGLGINRNQTDLLPGFTWRIFLRTVTTIQFFAPTFIPYPFSAPQEAGRQRGGGARPFGWHLLSEHQTTFDRFFQEQALAKCRRTLLAALLLSHSLRLRMSVPVDSHPARHGLRPDTRASFPGSGETTSSCAPPPLECVTTFRLTSAPFRNLCEQTFVLNSVSLKDLRWLLFSSWRPKWRREL